MGAYIKRTSDAALKEALTIFGAVLVEGPKWCGKTTSAQRACSSEFRIADPSGGYRNKRLAEIDPTLALEGSRPRLVDEWQEVPAIWDAVRYACDRSHGEPGQFVLTGSATPRDKVRPIHSGAGRIGRIRMDTMSLQELGVSNGSTSLRGLFEGVTPTGASKVSLGDLAEIICRGGWPATRSMPVEHARRVASSYIDAVVGEDLSQMDGIAREPTKVRRLISSLARNEATLATNKTIELDTVNATGTALATSTTRDYLQALERIFFTCDIPAWNPALRSPVRIRSAKKRHLADPSLAAAALNATPAALIDDQKTMGFLFESLVTHDLLVYARAMGASVAHYRDDSNLEVDLIVQARNGEWGAFEVKLGALQEDEGAKNVLMLDRKMTQRGERPAAVKAVIVGVGGIAHVREDGVAIIPIDVLGE